MDRVAVFEVHRFREGRWMIDSVYDDRDVALEEGRKLLSGRIGVAVRVVEERFDPESGDHGSRTIFEGRKGEFKQVTPAARPGPKLRPSAPPAAAKPKSGFIRWLVLMVLCTGGVGLALLLGLMALLDYVG